MTDAFDETQEFPFERRGVSIYWRRKTYHGVVVYRYKTTEDRANHLAAERAVLETR